MKSKFGYDIVTVCNSFDLQDYAINDYLEVQISHDTLMYKESYVSKYKSGDSIPIFHIEYPDTIIPTIVNDEGLQKIRDYIALRKDPPFDVAWEFVIETDGVFTIAKIEFLKKERDTPFTIFKHTDTYSLGASELISNLKTLFGKQIPESMLNEIIELTLTDAIAEDVSQGICSSTTKIWRRYAAYHGVKYNKDAQNFNYFFWYVQKPEGLESFIISLPTTLDACQMIITKFYYASYPEMLDFLLPFGAEKILSTNNEFIFSITPPETKLDLTLGFFPDKYTVNRRIGGMEMYRQDGICYYEKVEFQVYMGYHQQQYHYGMVNLPATDSGLINDFTPEGIKQIRNFIQETNESPEMFRWEYLFLRENKYSVGAYFSIRKTKKGYLVDSSVIKKTSWSSLEDFVTIPEMFFKDYNTLPANLITEIRNVVRELGCELPARKNIQKEASILLATDEGYISVIYSPGLNKFQLFNWKRYAITHYNKNKTIELPTNFERLKAQFDFITTEEYDQILKFMTTHKDLETIFTDQPMVEEEEIVPDEQPIPPKEEDPEEEVQRHIDTDEIDPIPQIVAEEAYVSKTNILNFDWSKFVTNEDLHLFKIIGKEIHRTEYTEAQYPDRENRFFNVKAEYGHELHVFSNAIYFYCSLKSRELLGLPNMVIKKNLKITNVFVSKNKIVIQALQRRVNREILIGLDKLSYEILEVKVY